MTVFEHADDANVSVPFVNMSKRTPFYDSLSPSLSLSLSFHLFSLSHRLDSFVCVYRVCVCIPLTQVLRVVGGVRESAVGVGGMVSTITTTSKLRAKEVVSKAKDRFGSGAEAKQGAVVGSGCGGRGQDSSSVEEEEEGEEEAWRQVLLGGEWWEEQKEKANDALPPLPSLSPSLPPPLSTESSDSSSSSSTTAPTTEGEGEAHNTTTTTHKRSSRGEELIVPPRTTSTSAFFVAKSSVLRWRFRVRRHDVGFALRLRAQDAEGGGSG